ncbi:MAG: hypothetical protein U0R19_10985 [Bryobacteraceae bacterium]
MASRKGTSVWTRLLIPDAGMMVAAVSLFFGLFLGDGPSKLFRDSDTGWHIRNGERLLDGHPLARTDPYSFTKPGQPWFAWEWGADAIMGAAHRSNGLPGVALLYAALSASCVWLWFRLHWMAGGNFFLACVMASPLLTTLQLHYLARPHVFGWLCSLTALSLMEGRGRRFGVWQAVGFGLFGAVWANLHASFFFLPGIAVLYAVSALVRRFLWDEPAWWQWYALAAVCSLAGTFVNPYGWGLHAHVLAYLSNSELLARIGEFQSFNFHAEGSLPILIAVLLALCGAVLALEARRPEHFLLLLGLTALALRSARALPLLALLALPLANGAITAALERAGVRSALRRKLDAFLAYSERLRMLESRCGGYAVAPLVLLLAFVILKAPAMAAQAGFPAKEFPVAAAAAVDALPANAKLLAPDKFGGYLIYRFDGRRKVFFDGRSDFYGVAFMKDYIRLIEARPGWRRQVEEFGFDSALLPNNYTLVDGLRQLGWQQVYRDDTATLLRK